MHRRNRYVRRYADALPFSCCPNVMEKKAAMFGNNCCTSVDKDDKNQN